MSLQRKSSQWKTFRFVCLHACSIPSACRGTAIKSKRIGRLLRMELLVSLIVGQKWDQDLPIINETWTGSSSKFNILLLQQRSRSKTVVVSSLHLTANKEKGPVQNSPWDIYLRQGVLVGGSGLAWAPKKGPSLHYRNWKFTFTNRVGD